jgi:hypothetical protein
VRLSGGWIVVRGKDAGTDGEAVGGKGKSEDAATDDEAPPGTVQVCGRVD